MKALASILLFGMVFLGLNRFSETVTPVQQEDEQCMMDCCCNHDDDCGDGEADNEQHQCPPGCDCSTCYHVVALTLPFLPNFEIKAQQRADYGSYVNSYHFEFLTPHFQPPRFS